MAVGISDMEEALAPFRVAWRCLDPVPGSEQSGTIDARGLRSPCDAGSFMIFLR
jgi:hypothetical protein